MTRSGLIALIVALFFPGLCSAERIRVLFVGNSYTSVNDLPATFAAVARSLGERVDDEMAAPGSATFESHAGDAETRAKIESKNWSFVVLQEQSQRPDFPDDQLKTQVIPFALRLDAFIHADGRTGKTVFFETWGHKNGDETNCRAIPETCTYEGMQRRIAKAYSRLAEKTSGLVAPVGDAWRNVRRSNPEIELYAPDGIHPSTQGTYLAACVFYSLLFKRGALGAAPLGLEPAQARLLQRAAQEAVFHRRPDN